MEGNHETPIMGEIELYSINTREENCSLLQLRHCAEGPGQFGKTGEVNKGHESHKERNTFIIIDRRYSCLNRKPRIY